MKKEKYVAKNTRQYNFWFKQGMINGMSDFMEAAILYGEEEAHEMLKTRKTDFRVREFLDPVQHWEVHRMCGETNNRLKMRGDVMVHRPRIQHRRRRK